MRTEARDTIYGLVAEFDSVDAIQRAAERIMQAGYKVVEAYTPFPVHGLPEKLGFERTHLPRIVLIGGIVGCLGGFFMQWFANVVHLPWNIGGRPLNSWPAFIPITFETTILGAALSCVLGMLALNKLPEPYHPLFKLERFQFASRDRFFICIEARDPQFDRQLTRTLLEGLQPVAVMEVPK